MPIKKKLGVPERHRMTVAIQTLKMPDAMVGVMGGGSKKDAREFLQKLGLTDKEIDEMIKAKTKKVAEEAGDYADTDDYGVMPFVKQAGKLRSRSYEPVEDEDRIVEEDESWEGPYFEVGFTFTVTENLPGLAELEIGRDYTIGAISGDPPVYAIVGDKNNKVVEIDARLFDDIVTYEGGEDEEGQDDDAQEDDLDEDTLSEMTPEQMRARRRSQSGEAKAAAHAKSKGLVKGPGGKWIRNPGGSKKKMVFGKMRTVESSDSDAQDRDLGEESDYIGHYLIKGDKTYADTAFMNVIGNAMPGMEMKHMGFGEFELTGDKGSIQFDRMRGKDFEGQVGRSHLVYDDKGGKLVKELIDKLKKAGKIQLSEGVASEVKMKVPVLFKKKGEKGKPAPLEVLRGLRESLIREACGGKKKSKKTRKIKESGGCGCGSGISEEKSEKDEAMDTLEQMGFKDKDAKAVYDAFMDNVLSRPKFFAAVKSFKRPPRTDWGDVYERLYSIFD
jgi:predicted transcriptional regulator